MHDRLELADLRERGIESQPRLGHRRQHLERKRQVLFDRDHAPLPDGPDDVGGREGDHREEQPPAALEHGAEDIAGAAGDGENTDRKSVV